MLRTIWSLIIGLLGISIMILIHEFGHFLAAKLFGVDVQVVSFGFGPPILKWGRVRTYQIGILPFGGFCKMKGEDDLRRALARKEKYVENAESGSLYSVSAFRRLVLYLFGPLFNLIFAVLCFFILLILPVQVPFSEPRIVVAAEYPELFPQASRNPLGSGLHTGDRIDAVDSIAVSSYQELQVLLTQRSTSGAMLTVGGTDLWLQPQDGLFGLAEFIRPLVASTAPESPERQAGLRNRDLILSINDRKVTNMFDILSLKLGRPEEFRMLVSRGSDEVEIRYAPVRDADGGISLGFTLVEEGRLQCPRSFAAAFSGAIEKTLSVFGTGVKSIADILAGRNSVHETVAGTFGASSSIGELTTRGFNENFSKGLRVALYLMAGVSTSIAIANLLPIPSLDGGLILLSFVEMVKGKNASARVYIVCQICGLLLVLALVVVLNFVR